MHLWKLQSIVPIVPFPLSLTHEIQTLWFESKSVFTHSSEVAKLSRCSFICFSLRKKIKVLVARNPIWTPPPVRRELAVIALGSSGRAILKKSAHIIVIVCASTKAAWLWDPSAAS